MHGKCNYEIEMPEETQKEGKSPIKEREKAKKERKFPIKRGRESKKKKEKKRRRKKIPDQRSEENIRNMQKGLWTIQYLKNTELSPRKQKKRRKETAT